MILGLFFFSFREDHGFINLQPDLRTALQSLSRDELLWLKRRETERAASLVNLILVDKPHTAAWLLFILTNNTKKRFTAKRAAYGFEYCVHTSRFRDSTSVTRGKARKLRHLLTTVNRGIRYCNIRIYDEPAEVNWIDTFISFIFFKNVISYILVHYLREVLPTFVGQMSNPLGRIAFLDILEGRLKAFTLEGHECVVVAGMLCALKDDLVNVLKAL